MDKKDYLDKLTAETRPQKPAGKPSKILSSKIFMVCFIGLILLIMIIIIGAILGSNKSDKKTVAYTLALHLNSTGEVIHDYQPKVKSSILRSTSASLSSVLSDTYGKLNGYLTEKYKVGAEKADKKLIDAAALNKDALEADLFEAKITGVLDKTYANKMVYEISLIKAEEEQLITKSDEDKLKEILTTSYNSLNKLYDEFNNFSGSS